MYLAALVPQKVPLSTYFIATLEGVGGGGLPEKIDNIQTKKKVTQKRNHKTPRPPND